MASQKLVPGPDSDVAEQFRRLLSYCRPGERRQLALPLEQRTRRESVQTSLGQEGSLLSWLHGSSSCQEDGYEIDR